MRHNSIRYFALVSLYVCVWRTLHLHNVACVQFCYMQLCSSDGNNNNNKMAQVIEEEEEKKNRRNASSNMQFEVWNYNRNATAI